MGHRSQGGVKLKEKYANVHEVKDCNLVKHRYTTSREISSSSSANRCWDGTGEGIHILDRSIVTSSLIWRRRSFSNCVQGVTLIYLYTVSAILN